MSGVAKREKTFWNLPTGTTKRATGKVIQSQFCASQRNDSKRIGFRTEWFFREEILPSISIRLLEIVVLAADGKRPFNLCSQLNYLPVRPLVNQQQLSLCHPLCPV